jgi:outer membrane protein OmpA-like peptidoglycan-associated protein
MRIRNLSWALLISILLVNVAGAIDWTNRYGAGIRGPLLIPLDNGKNYKAFGGDEPFMMGLNMGLDLKRGISKNFVLDFTLSMATTYDDTSGGGMSTSFYNKDNAYSKLTGVLAGLTGQYYFRQSKAMQPYILFGAGIDFWKMTVLETLPEYGNAAKDDKYRFSDLNLKLGLGFNYWLSERLSFDLQGRMNWGITNLNTTGRPLIYGRASHWSERPFTDYFEPTVGLTYYFGISSDSDHDGVKDKYDVCAETPQGALVDKYGCPLDSDGDEVFDGIDLCPDTPKGALVDITGCPLDSDQDGVFDGIDKCPNTPKGVPVDKLGCPLDTDKDGVPDFKDKEISTPIGAKVDQDGVGLDGDGDGVYDGLDKCPTTAAGVKVDSVGCPIDVKPPAKKITLNIKYKTGSFDPDAASKKILDDLAETMKAYTSMQIEIGGFTDDVGTNEANKLLSQKRADAVMAYLQSKGIELARMKAEGFGEEPNYFVADNKTPEGRQQNRRVEIISVEKQ